MKKLSLFKILLLAFTEVLVLWLLIFLGAGRLDYWQGWGFTIVLIITIVALLIIFRKHTDLANERLKPGPGTKWWDKVFMFFNAFLFMGILVVGILDGGRFIWSGNIPVWVYKFSYLAYVIGTSIIIWSMWENKYFSSVVRIQKDRGQKVISSGPYKIVRHPGYFGAIIMALACGPMLGSYWAMIFAVLWSIAIIVRTSLEDKTLQKELEGYKEYQKKTPYRLIPGLWAFLLSLTILTGCTSPADNQITWQKYEGPWFDIDYPSNYKAVDLNKEAGLLRKLEVIEEKDASVRYVSFIPIK